MASAGWVRARRAAIGRRRYVVTRGPQRRIHPRTNETGRASQQNPHGSSGKSGVTWIAGKHTSAQREFITPMCLITMVNDWGGGIVQVE